MADSKYKGLTKDELIAEIKNRRDNGSDISVDLRKDEATLITALELDDISGTSQPPTATPAVTTPPVPPVAPTAAQQAPKPNPTVELDGSLENQVPLQPEMPSEATQPADDIFAKGFKAKNKNDTFVYQVVKVEGDDPRPYKARVPKQASGHPGLFWEGTEEDFKSIFDKQ